MINPRTHTAISGTRCKSRDGGSHQRLRSTWPSQCSWDYFILVVHRKLTKDRDTTRERYDCQLERSQSCQRSADRQRSAV